MKYVQLLYEVQDQKDEIDRLLAKCKQLKNQENTIEELKASIEEFKNTLRQLNREKKLLSLEVKEMKESEDKKSSELQYHEEKISKMKKELEEKA